MITFQEDPTLKLIREYNENPKVIAWKAERAAKEEAARIESGKRYLEQEAAFEEMVRSFNEAFRQEEAAP